METINLSAARVGMVLSEDVTGNGGHVLLRVGTLLSERHLALLQAHGIEQITVGPAPITVVQPRDAATVESMLASRFQSVDTEHPMIKELLRLCQQRFARAAPEVAHGG